MTKLLAAEFSADSDALSPGVLDRMRRGNVGYMLGFSRVDPIRRTRCVEVARLSGSRRLFIDLEAPPYDIPYLEAESDRLRLLGLEPHWYTPAVNGDMQGGYLATNDQIIHDKWVSERAALRIPRNCGLIISAYQPLTLDIARWVADATETARIYRLLYPFHPITLLLCHRIGDSGGVVMPPDNWARMVGAALGMAVDAVAWWHNLDTFDSCREHWHIFGAL